MTPDQTIDQHEELLGRLIACLIDEPRAMDFNGYRMIERVNWKVGVSINDYGKLAGKQGAHGKALRVVAARIGDKVGNQYHIRTVPPETPGRGAPIRTKPARDYNAHAARELLADLLGAALQSPPGIGVVKSTTNVAGEVFEEFTFTVRPTAVQDHDTLLAQFELGRGETMSLEAALGTLFRAYGRRVGVCFVVNVP